MDFTDNMYIGLRDGRCVAIAWQCAGRDGTRRNARTVAEWTRDGLDVLTLHKDQCGQYHDQMREDALRDMPQKLL